MDVSGYIDATLLILLLGIGKLIKSSSLFEKIPNKYITVILPLMGVIIEVISKKSISVENISLGLYTGLAATGTHQVGKQLFVNNKSNEKAEDESSETKESDDEGI